MTTSNPLTLLSVEELKGSHDMVAAAVYVEGADASHAALIIRRDNEWNVFHFYKDVLLQPAAEAASEGRFIFAQELDFVPSFLVPSFLAHCLLVSKQAKPKFGFFYDPRSFYDSSGKFRNPGTFPEYMTCVGFCLTVIQSYLIKEQFLQYSDWDQRSYDLDQRRMAFEMVQMQRNFPDLQPEEIQKAVRRILPIEYFSGAYSSTRPVPKIFTDKIATILLDEIVRKVA